MRKSKKNLSVQRQIIEKKLRPWLKLRIEKPPRSGWIKAVRETLGMNIRQLAIFMGIDQGNVLRLEQREAKGKASLESVNKAAMAMDCKLIYAIVPRDQFSSLDAIVSQYAERLADEILERVEHTMQLEKQGTGSTKAERKKLAEELKLNLDSRIWNKKRSENE